MSLQPLSITMDEVHLWYVIPEQITDPSLLSSYHRLLNPDEAAQQRRYHFERHRHQYLVTRAMIRTLLGRYLGLDPASLRFVKNEYGRPELVPEQQSLPIHFNLSHTDGLIACGIVLNREIGVDVEDITRGGDLVQIADRFFSPSEVTDLHTVPSEKQEYRFFDYWTMKEAYIKARGMGLSIPLEQFSYHINDQDPHITISIDERQNDDPTRWQFKQWFYEPKFKIAICLERDSQHRAEVVARDLVPMRSESSASAREFRSSEDWV